ncbi:hypothetical protein MTO96_022397 [Rhipicephalus appendiculatus]
MFCFGNQLVRLVRLLQSFNHITSIRFSVRMGDPLLASSIAAYVQAATSLQRLLLTLYCDDGDTEENTKTSWTELLGALSLNTSVKELGVYVDINCDDVQRCAVPRPSTTPCPSDEVQSHHKES